MREHGVPNDALAVLPNLGMRLTIRELSDAASQTPTDERSRVVFLGRLSKPKGAQLLPDLANRLGADSLAVFGDGYLRTELQTSIGPALRGHLSQERVAGVLQWARAVVFPSLWPEPGGIVGIDAQLFGAPLGAFAVGSALDWPHAALFEPRDVRRLSEWASAQPDVTTARATEAIARAQTEYW
jgi:glycosyltransferase involved in cell wall biosynthesis